MERQEFIESIKGLTIEELAQIIENNFTTNEGTINIRGLKFAGKLVDISGMKAKEINQSKHITDIIYQDEHKAVFISQSHHNAYEIEQKEHAANYIDQNDHEADYINQSGQTVKKLFDGGHKERED